MYGVLILPPARDVAASATALAAALGGTAYDHRQPLLRNLPYLTAWNADVGPVRSLAAQLSVGGLEAWPVSRTALDLAPGHEAVRSFELEADRVTFQGRQRAFILQRGDIGLILPCRSDAGQLVTTTTTTKKLGIAQMAMGIPIARKVVETEQQRALEQRFFGLVWATVDGSTSVLFELQAEGLSYSGLGSHKTGSSTSNFLLLMQYLHNLVPAVWDPRLERAGSKIAPISAPQGNTLDKPNRSTTVARAVEGWDTQGALLQSAQLLVLAARLRAASGLSPRQA